jgi:hypothetical protein
MVSSYLRLQPLVLLPGLVLLAPVTLGADGMDGGVVLLHAGAQLRLPPGHRFVGRSEALRILAAEGNSCSGQEIGLVFGPAPSPGFVVVARVPAGYIAEPGGQGLDAPRLFAALEERAIRSGPRTTNNPQHRLVLEGWTEAPCYDPHARAVSWSIAGRLGRRPFVCSTVNRLTREGAFQFTDVVPGPAAAASRRVQAVAVGLALEPGHRHQDARPGDPVAAAGLLALVGQAGAPAVEPGPTPLATRTIQWGPGGVLGVGSGVALVSFLTGVLLGRQHRRRHGPAVGLTYWVQRARAGLRARRRRRHHRRSGADVYYFALTRDLLRTRK